MYLEKYAFSSKIYLCKIVLQYQPVPEKTTNKAIFD